MSSAGSRQRQRQRRRARERLWEAQRVLADRQACLAAYEHVVADMERLHRDQNLSFTGSRAIPTVAEIRNTVRAECGLLLKLVADLTLACEQIAAAATTTSDPKETMAP